MITEVCFHPRADAGATPRPALVEWLVGEDELVTEGTPLLFYESDKAIAPFATPTTGYLRRQLLAAGNRFSPGDALALLSDSLDEPLPGTFPAPSVEEDDDEHDFDWSEIDNRSGDPEPLGVMRQAIANRMTMSKRHIPCFYLTATVDMTACIALRATLKKSGRKATFNDMAIKASALALSRNPKAVSVYSPAGLIPRTDLNIGFAAALPDDGLVVPVVKRADQKSVADIADETRGLAAKAKNGDLVPGDCAGGVFSVSYLGGFEVDNFIAIVNPGEAAILAMGKTTDTPVVADGAVVVRPIASLTLSCDHRSIDGSLAARLMGDIKRLLENPAGL